MAKRIVSGIFILTALGALGVILAGAMTSGEQLIVRFLTAVTVAALALYVISDLRLQNEQEEPSVERDRQHPDRSVTQATAAESVVATTRRRERFVRRGRDASVQPTPNFEAIEPVTARPRPAPLADPTEAVTGSRLVPSAAEHAEHAEHVERIVPPHPTTGLSTEARPDRPAPFAIPPSSTPSIPVEDAHPVRVDAGLDDRLDDPVDGVVERAVEEVGDNRADVEPEYATPPDERRPTSSNGSVIATRSFTYSGRLDSVGVEWPPRPPETDDLGAQIEDGEAAALASAIDAPTAELPALTGLTALGTMEDPLVAPFAAGIADWENGDRSTPPDPTAHFFAIDTAEVHLSEPGGSKTPEKVESADDANRAPSNEEHKPVEDSAVSGAEPDDSPPFPSSQVDPTPATPLIRRVEVGLFTAPPTTDHLGLVTTDDLIMDDGPETTGDLVTTDDVDRSFPAVRPAGSAPPGKLTAAIRSGEIQVINSLISQGMLSTSGPITDRDVRTMVYVAFTSNELRKLILAGGTPDGIRAGDLDLGEVELFDESRFAPPPKLLYSGPAEQSDVILDLVALENESGVTGSSDSGPGHDLDDLDDGDLVPTLPTPRHLYRTVDADRVEH